MSGPSERDLEMADEADSKAYAAAQTASKERWDYSRQIAFMRVEYLIAITAARAEGRLAAIEECADWHLEKAAAANAEFLKGNKSAYDAARETGSHRRYAELLRALAKPVA